MAGRILGNNGGTVPYQAAESDNGGSLDGASPQRGDGELRRMAAFRVRETANRITVLAHSARSEDLREKLHAICHRLLSEERALLDGGGPPRDT